ncbi:MAG TPA: MEDS domain-containing protein [Novimethylophilus sp.]|uniref:MEDS domain-containing protein n=1 Tax=Novimethylophilus sp. TaxID=2137426 RepID=UPI002F40BE91
MNIAGHEAEELLNIKQAAKILNTSEISLRRWSDSGKLPCLRIGVKRERRFRLSDLYAYLEQGTVAGSSVKVEHATGRVAHIKLEGIAIDYGSHLCAFYETDPGRLKMSLPFLLDGLQAGDRCFMVAADAAQTHILGELRSVRPAIDMDMNEGRLVVMDGMSSGAEMYAFLEKSFLDASKHGIHRLRVLGDMAWFLHKGMGIDELNEFEARYNTGLGHRFPVVSLCQYDTREFSGTAILGALKCHDDTFRYPLTRFLGI